MNSTKQDRREALKRQYDAEMAKPEAERRSDLTQLAQALIEAWEQCQEDDCGEQAMTIQQMPDSPIKDILLVRYEDGEVNERFAFCSHHIRWTPNSL